MGLTITSENLFDENPKGKNLIWYIQAKLLKGGIQKQY